MTTAFVFMRIHFKYEQTKNYHLDDIIKTASIKKKRIFTLITKCRRLRARAYNISIFL